MTRLFLVMTGTVAALAVAVPVGAQGKGKVHKSTPPSSLALPSPAVTATATAGALPFAWIDDASVLAPGDLSFSIAALLWQGTDLHEVDVPVVGVALGLAKRVQIGASLPRVVGSTDPSGVAGGLGTTFVSGKVSVLTGARTGVKLAVAPTFEILGERALQSAAPGQSRTQFGLPVSLEIDRGGARVFGSGGYFSGGTWFAGGGVGSQLGSRVAVSMAFSRAWTTDPTAALVHDRREVSGGAAWSLKPRISLFGSVGRSIATADADGAGTTITGGVLFLLKPAVGK